MDEKWHTIKIRVSDDVWLQWKISLLQKGKTADVVVSHYVKQYVKKGKPVQDDTSVVSSKPLATRRPKGKKP